ncbi:MAG: acetolactate synthase large subunit, partial [Corynebacterium sp.]|nr:acetolactate synthase large subunit [Corynebacterium sp.]
MNVAASQQPTPATVANRGRSGAPERMTGAQAIVRSLEELNAEIIFGIPGGAVLPVYDPLYSSEK